MKGKVDEKADQMKKPDAILVGDLHIRDDTPKCRLDDFWQTQKRKMLWLKDLWESLDKPPILQPGDVFHKWKSSPQVINAVLNWLPPMVTIPGNPGKHNYFTQEGFERDALSVVASSKRRWVVLGDRKNWIPELPNDFMEVHAALWEKELIQVIPHPSGRRQILITHKMIVQERKPFEGEYAGAFLRRMKSYDLILTGHNHQSFVQEQHGRLLVNPGSFTRQSTSEDHRPVVYLWHAANNTVEVIYVPIEDGVISKEHIDTPKERDERIAAFVERLDTDLEVTIRFKDNILTHIEANEIRDMVKERVLEAIDES